MSKQTAFPKPHEIGPVPGTEGWERMYPDYYQFVTDDPERMKYEEEALWFFNGLNFPEAMFPFDTIWAENCYLGLSQYNTRIFSVPTAFGMDQRMLNGYVYFSPVPVKDPEQVQQRVGDFMERAGYYYENWTRLESQWEVKMKALLAELEGLAIDPLPEIEDISVVTEGLGKSKGYLLLNSYDKLIDLGCCCWQYHFEHLNLGYAAYVTFLDFCQKIFPDIPLQRVSQMVGGVDVIMYQPDEELKKLARHAIELGVDAVLISSKTFDEAERHLSANENGTRWLALLEESREPWFNISTGTGMYHHHKSWNDDLNVPFSSICDYITKLNTGASIDRPTERVRQERDRTIAEYRALIDNDEDRAAFDQLLGTAQTVFPYVENHLFYVEHWFHSVFWNKVREFSRILVDHGMIHDVEDIWYLKRGEIKDALWDLVTSWATGVKPRGRTTLPKEIEWRKGVLQKFREWSPPPALGTLPEKIQEPFTIVLWGITNDSLNSWSEIQEHGVNNGTGLKGFPASPGSVTGKARVCMTVDDVIHLEEGEILVAPTTSPSWAPSFTKIKACVTDVGGVMCHAAIVCREYGMPAVVGTGHGTKLITTGQEISVDGVTGEVHLH